MLTGKFWYGLKTLHYLTTQGDWELRIEQNGSYRRVAGGIATPQTYVDFRILLYSYKEIEIKIRLLNCNMTINGSL